MRVSSSRNFTAKVHRAALNCRPFHLFCDQPAAADLRPLSDLRFSLELKLDASEQYSHAG